MESLCPIVIITQKCDSHADAVVERLHDARVGVLRVHFEDFATDHSLTTTSGFEVELTDKHGRVACLGGDRTAVWHRKPVQPNVQNADWQASAVNFVSSETQAAIDQILGCSNIAWVNHPDANRRCSRKLQQLAIAANLGFRVPRTLITNVPEDARRFVASCERGAICKVFREYGFHENGKVFGLFTHIVDANNAKWDLIAQCPTLLQERIRKSYELRVNVFGEAAFATALRAPVRADDVDDWRSSPPGEVEHVAVDLGDETAARLKRFMRHYGLLFAAFDLIVTPEGETVFLECNPNGQWLWIELLTRQPLAAAAANLLISQARR